MKKEQIANFLRKTGTGAMSLARRGIEHAKPIAAEARVKAQEKVADLYQKAKESDRAQQAQRRINEARDRVTAQKDAQLTLVRGKIQAIAEKPRVAQVVDKAQTVGTAASEFVTPKVQALSSRVKEHVGPVIKDKKDRVNARILQRAVSYFSNELVNNPQTWKDLKTQISQKAPTVAHSVAEKLNPDGSSPRKIYQTAFGVESLDQPKRAVFETASVALSAETRLFGAAATWMFNKTLDSNVSKQDINSILAVRFVAPHLTSDIQTPPFILNVGNQIGELYQNVRSSIQDRFFPGNTPTSVV